MEPDYKEIVRQMQAREGALRAENQELRAQLSGDQQGAASWLQMKAARQRKELDRLNRKVLTQRFRLRLLSELGRDVSYDEYVAARDALGVKRIDDYEVLV